MNSATVIIPTTGSNDLEQAITSVIGQTKQTDICLVVDGYEYIDNVNRIINKFANTNIKIGRAHV